MLLSNLQPVGMKRVAAELFAGSADNYNYPKEKGGRSISAALRVTNESTTAQLRSN
jgi:hypothetical protein